MHASYREAAVVLAASLVQETWGRIVSKAQVSGIPALASDRGALPETVAAGGVLMTADALFADWCVALAGAWRWRGCGMTEPITTSWGPPPRRPGWRRRARR